MDEHLSRSMRVTYTSAAQSTTGAMRRHGPHQSATKSTSTGSSDSSTSAAKSLCPMTFTAAKHRTRARGRASWPGAAGATQQRDDAGWAGARRSVAGRRGPRAGKSGERGGGARVDEAVVLGMDAMRTMPMSGEERNLLEGANG